MTHNDILESLRQVVHVETYVIATENHGNRRIHYHVVLVKRQKYDIKSSNLLNLIYNEEIFHGNQLRWSSAHLLPSPPFGGRRGKWGMPSPPARKNRLVYLPPGWAWMELVPFPVPPRAEAGGPVLDLSPRVKRDSGEEGLGRRGKGAEDLIPVPPRAEAGGPVLDLSPRVKRDSGEEGLGRRGKGAEDLIEETIF